MLAIFSPIVVQTEQGAESFSEIQRINSNFDGFMFKLRIFVDIFVNYLFNRSSCILTYTDFAKNSFYRKKKNVHSNNENRMNQYPSVQKLLNNSQWHQ